jgi:hypothetical protein
MWDNYGLESVIDITQYELINDEVLLDMIKTGKPGKKDKFTGIFQSLLIRAQVNAHRNYELYAFQTTEEVSTEDIKNMFKSQPQISAELIRQNGVKIYSNRATQKSVIY